MPFKELSKDIKFVRLRHSSEFSYVQVLRKPEDWQCAGVGNSAAVFRHRAYPGVAIKVFSDACRHVARQESKVYEKLGDSFFYPRFYGNGENFLLMQYLPGLSVYDCLLRGIHIPEQIVRNIDEAVSYARERGLNPRNLHAKNVLVHNRRGYLVDVSEYMDTGKCHHWNMLRYLYYRFYARFCRPGVRIPFWVLECVRRAYRILRMGGIPF